MSIESTIHDYFGRLESDQHHRYRSWEHCYRFFQMAKPSGIMKDRDHAALQLGFYLASWGMYRGGSFLLQCTYTVHLKAVDCLADRRWLSLWQSEFGANDEDEKKISDIVELRRCLTDAYSPFGVPTDILATKIMLGTFGCSPACDRFFVSGFKGEGYSFSYFNQQFLTRVLQYSRKNRLALRRAQKKIEDSVGTHYPLMKLVDMYFFQKGCEGNS